MSAAVFLDWATGVGVALLALVAAAIAHDTATHNRRHDREGD